MARKKVKALKGASRPKAPQPAPSKRRRLSDVYEVDDDEREDTVAEALDPEAFDPDADPDFGSDDESIDEEMAFTAEDTDLAAMFDEDETGPGATGRYQGLDMDSDEEGDDEDEELARYLGDEEDDDEGGAGLVPSEEEAGDSGEEDEARGQRGDERGTDEEQEQRHREMLEAVVGGAERKMGKRKRERRLVSEVYAEDELNVQHRTATAGTAGGELRVADLVRGLGAAAAKLGGARKDLEKLDAAPVVEVPAAPVVKERAARQAAYQESKKEVGKWQAIVKTNREASTVWFKGAEGAPRLTTTAALAARADAPATDLEAEVAQLLQAAGAADARAVKDTEEALALKELTAEEMTQRREAMAKQQALLFYHELKAKRLKKIKSKAYHRRLTKATKRLAETQAEAALDEEDAQEQQQRAEFERAKERLTLRHKNSSRWARRVLKRGLHLADDGARAAIAEQLRVGQELRQKAQSMHSGSNSESDASSASDDDDGAALTGKAKSAALEMLEDGEEGNGRATKGILSLPFMQRAMQRQREAAREEARVALREIEEWEGGGSAAGPAAAAADGGGGTPFGRMSFVAEGAAARGESEEEEEEAGFDAGESSDEEPQDTQHLANRQQKQASRSAAGRRVRQAAGDCAAPAAADSANGALLAHRITLPESATDSSTSGRGVAGRSAAGVAQAAVANATRKQLFDAAPRPHAGAGSGGGGGDSGGGTGVAGEAGAAFLRSSKFKGARPGFVFKTGKKGLGYYRDNSTKLPREASAQGASAAGRSAAEKSVPEGEPETELEGGGAAGADDTEVHPEAMKPVGAAEQRQLIAEAFAGDDVQEEFERDKLRDVEEQVAHVEEPSAMPGWGSWGLKSEPKWLQEARQQAKLERQRLIAGRRDSKLPHVILSEQWDKKANAKYMTTSVPFPHQDKSTYDSSMRQPLGRDFNTDRSFRNFTRPAVIHNAGVLIQPIRMAGAAQSKSEAAVAARKQIKRTAASVVTVAGGVARKGGRRK